MKPNVLKKLEKNMRQINLASMEITDDDIPDIMHKIQELNLQATAYDLDDNQITDRGARMISNALQRVDNISWISLQFNHIGKQGAADLLNLKLKFHGLELLLHGNPVSNNELMDIKNSTFSQSHNQRNV